MITNSFKEELRALLNKYSQENGSNTPDFILAEYLSNCLDNWNSSISRRQDWYGGGPTNYNEPKMDPMPYIMEPSSTCVEEDHIEYSTTVLNSPPESSPKAAPLENPKSNNFDFFAGTSWAGKKQGFN